MCVGYIGMPNVVTDRLDVRVHDIGIGPLSSKGLNNNNAISTSHIPVEDVFLCQLCHNSSTDIHSRGSGSTGHTAKTKHSQKQWSRHFQRLYLDQLFVVYLLTTMPSGSPAISDR